MNEPKIINVIKSLVEYQNNNHGIPLDKNSNLIKETNKAIEHLRYLHDKRTNLDKHSIKVRANMIHLLLTEEEKNTLVKMLNDL